MSAPAAVHRALEQAHSPEKRWADAAARAALLGVTAHRMRDDRGRQVFIVTRFHLTREFDSIEALEAWVGRLEGRT